jgi:glyoxylase-like metal-dependent hydrolase (beta-lactamase superfamily II)
MNAALKKGRMSNVPESNVMDANGGRREFLKRALAAGAGVSVASFVGTSALARAKAEAIAIAPIADNVALVTGAGTNVVIVTGPEGVVMIDGGVAERSGDLLKAITKHARGEKPATLFNTHWHWDHTGSNERLGKSGAKIIAHENTKLWLGAEFEVEWEGREYRPRPREAWPNDTFYNGRRTFDFGNEKLVYGWLPRAHTDGDIYIHIPARNVLVAGDLVSVGRYPILDVATGGWLGGMVDANKALIELCDDKTVVVPGTGALQTKADLVAQHQMLSTMKDRLVGLMRKGMGYDDLLAAPPTGEFDAKWGDPKLFLTNAFRGLWGHVRELGGIV